MGVVSARGVVRGGVGVAFAGCCFGTVAGAGGRAALVWAVGAGAIVLVVEAGAFVDLVGPGAVVVTGRLTPLGALRVRFAPVVVCACVVAGVD